MRTRLLSPGFFRNEVLGELPLEARLTFAGLWCLADREGRLEDRPKRIKAELFPWDSFDIEGSLSALDAEGFIQRYTVGVLKCIQITRFLVHQKPHTRETASRLPAPDGTPELPESEEGEPGTRPKSAPGEPETNLGCEKDGPRLPVSVSETVSGGDARAHARNNGRAEAMPDWARGLPRGYLPEIDTLTWKSPWRTLEMLTGKTQALSKASGDDSLTLAMICADLGILTLSPIGVDTVKVDLETRIKAATRAEPTTPRERLNLLPSRRSTVDR